MTIILARNFSTATRQTRKRITPQFAQCGVTAAAAHELKKQYSISDYLTYGGFPKAIEQPDKTSIVQYLNDLNQTMIMWMY